MVIAIFLLFIILMNNIVPLIQCLHTETYTVTVTRLDSKRYKKSEKWLVFGEDPETGELYEFENTDNLFKKKWNSSSVQNGLKEGETYIVETCGWRIPIISWYPNIIKAKQVE